MPWYLKLLGFRYAPDEPAAGTPAPATPVEPAEPDIPAGSPVSTADLHVAAQTPAQPVAATTTTPAPATPATPATPEWTSARAYAEQMGFAGATQQYQDDSAFLNHVLLQAQQAQQLQQLQPYAQAYLQHAGDFQQYLAQKQQPAAPAPPKKMFELPEWNPAWESLITKDAAGNLTVQPGADPTILGKYHAYQRARSDIANRLITDPEGTLGPVIEQRAQGMVEKIIEQRLAKMAEQQQAQQYAEKNASWLYAADPQGRQVINPQTGSPVLSGAGQRFLGHLQAAEKMGVTNLQAQQHYAEALLRSEMLNLQLANLQAQQKGANGQQQVIDANRQPNQGGSFHGHMPGGNGAPQNQSLSLKDQMAQAFAQNGITDQHILAEV